MVEPSREINIFGGQWHVRTYSVRTCLALRSYGAVIVESVLDGVDEPAEL